MARRIRAAGWIGAGLVVFAGGLTLSPGLAAQTRLAAVAPTAESELRDLVDRYTTDRMALTRRYPVQDPERAARFKSFYQDWQTQLEAAPFDALGVEGRIDYVLLRTKLAQELVLLERQQKLAAETTPLVPFAATVFTLNDSRMRMESLDPSKAAATLSALAVDVDKARKAAESSRPPKLLAYRAQDELDDLAGTLKAWYGFYSGYDPLFTWWNEAPYKAASKAIDEYRKLLRDKVLGIKAGEDEPIVGTPIGREALASDLRAEFIAYSPEDLIAMGDREFAWCEAELKKASREMGFGDDWKKALEKVKTLYVEPGKQPDLIRDLAREAEAYVEKNDLITVPPLAKEVWRMQMMTPERQKVNPFFTGGETISVSYPTNTMDQDDKMMSMRGNNIHFARATVFHELIPGHHLQGFMTQRYNAHRRAFQTPFWGEGWALYWEMLLWDRGFQRSPEDRVGMLFWRMHRASRILFSLRFHLGEWTPQQCIDFLVDRGGHERANAEAEVRRSFNGSYQPLYQLAYMMGGLEFYALHKELVTGGKMTDKAFHDAIITGGTMPVELVRARLTKQSLPKDYKASWKYYGPSPVSATASH